MTYRVYDGSRFVEVSPEEYARRNHRHRGLGDLVASVAQPIARAIDRVAGTKIQNCKRCTGPGGRKDRLNEIMPDVKAVLNKLVPKI